MLAAMSGIDSTVAVASRNAYIFLSAGAISGVWPIESAKESDHDAADALELRTGVGEREVGSKTRNGLELVERSSRVPERPARHHRNDDTERGDQGRKHERHLVADAARGVFVDAGAREVAQLEAISAQQHRIGEGGGLGAIEAAKETGHQQRRHLVIGNVSLGVGERHGAPLARLDPASVALTLDQAMCEH